MRRFFWAGVAVMAVVALGGLVRAHTNRESLISGNETVATSTGEWQCPLSWLMSQCGLSCSK
jgi:hypothetical protein